MPVSFAGITEVAQTYIREVLVVSPTGIGIA